MVYQRTLRKIILTCFMFILCSCVCNLKVHAASKEMNVYGLYLNSDEKGDSVLVESKGKYILMDLGEYDHIDAIIKELKAKKVESLDIYLSHLHKDHVGAGGGGFTSGLNRLVGSGVKINKLYLPDPSLAPQSIGYDRKYEQLKSFMNYMNIVYLKVGSKFQVGDATVKIIGPVNTNRISLSDYPFISIVEKYVYYENDCSLVASVQCGKVKFLTTGDILKKQADLLVSKYKGTGELKADILKLSHHGTGSGNTSTFMKEVSPSFTFASNTGEDKINPLTGKWKTNVARKHSIKTGMCYLVGNEKKTIVYQVKSNNIKLYKKSVSPTNMLKGWVKVVGGDGHFRRTDKYYFNADGKPKTGVQKIGGNYYYLGAGGCMEYGSYGIDGNYLFYKKYKRGSRYFTYSKDKQFAIMARGFKRIGSKMYYFDKYGYKLKSKSGTELIKIGDDYYGIGTSGAIVNNNAKTIKNKKYFFGNNGKMARDKVITIEGEKYYFDINGKMVVSKSGTKIITYLNNQYAVRKNGEIVTNMFIKSNGNKYYFGKNGKMKKNIKVRINRHSYFFDKKGRMVEYKMVKIGKYKYYFGISGIMLQNKRFVMNGKQYICDSAGRIK